MKLPKSVYDQIDRIFRNFIWGSDVERKRIHLVGWDTVCMSKEDGGLEFRKAQHSNNFF